MTLDWHLHQCQDLPTTSNIILKIWVFNGTKNSFYFLSVYRNQWLIYEFIKRSWLHLSNIIFLSFLFLCIVVRYRTFLWVPMLSCVFSMHPDWPLLEVIRLSCVFLCINYDSKWAFVGDLPIPCVLNGPNRPLSDIHLSCEFAMSEFPIFIWNLL